MSAAIRTMAIRKLSPPELAPCALENLLGLSGTIPLRLTRVEERRRGPALFMVKVFTRPCVSGTIHTTLSPSSIRMTDT